MPVPGPGPRRFAVQVPAVKGRETAFHGTKKARGVKGFDGDDCAGADARGRHPEPRVTLARRGDFGLDRRQR